MLFWERPTIDCEVRALSAGNLALKEAKLRPKCESGESASKEKAGSRFLHFSREAQADARYAASPWCAALRKPKPACLKHKQACAHCPSSREKPCDFAEGFLDFLVEVGQGICMQVGRDHSHVVGDLADSGAIPEQP